MIKALAKITFFIQFILIAITLNAQNPNELKIVSWNVKHLGRKGFDEKSAANLLTQADLVVFQEVNTTNPGKAALWKLKDAIQSKNGEYFCVGYSEIPEGEKERFAFLWKNARLAYVTTKGEAIKDCSSMGFTFRLGVKHAKAIAREPAIGVFQDKTNDKNFTVAAVHLRPSGKRPQDEVPPLLDTLLELNGPLIMMGDFNLDARHPVFKAAKETLKLQPLFKNGEKTSLKMKKRELANAYDNMWFRGFTPITQKVINLFEAFPTLEPSSIYKQLSDHCPIEGTFVAEQN